MVKVEPLRPIAQRGQRLGVVVSTGDGGRCFVQLVVVRSMAGQIRGQRMRIGIAFAQIGSEGCTGLGIALRKHAFALACQHRCGFVVGHRIHHASCRCSLDGQFAVMGSHGRTVQHAAVGPYVHHGIGRVTIEQRVVKQSLVNLHHGLSHGHRNV